MTERHNSSPESLAVRAALPQDWQAARALLQSAGLPVEDLAAERMHDFLLAERSQSGARQPAGIIGLEQSGSVALLRSLVVSEQLRGAGLGRQLLSALEAKARAAGVTQLWLLTIDADEFFASAGFATAGRQDAPEAIRASQEFSELCPDDAILMVKTL